MSTNPRYSLYFLTFPNGKHYVGITTNFNNRMSHHKHESKACQKYKLYRAIRKYGWNNVVKDHAITGLTHDEACDYEKHIITELDLTRSGYNTSPGGYLPFEGLGEVTRKRMQDPTFREKALSAMRAPEAEKRRIESLKSDDFKLKCTSRENKLRDSKKITAYNRKPVVCNETGECFSSIRDAADAFSGQRTHLRDHLHGKKDRPRFKGKTFKFMVAA